MLYYILLKTPEHILLYYNIYNSQLRNIYYYVILCITENPVTYITMLYYI